MSTLSQTQKELQAELVRLMSENPGIKILPIVDFEVVVEDDGSWPGRLTQVYLEEAAVVEGQTLIKSEQEDLIKDAQNQEDLDALTDISGVVWEKVVVVSISK